MKYLDDTISSHIIEINNITYRFLIKNIDKKEHGVIIFFTSAKGLTPRNKHIFPYYTRISWADSLPNYTCIFVSDPFELSPICNESLGSWFIDTNGKSLLPTISNILKKIIGDKHGPLVLYGSSMGGYAALLSAYYLNANHVIAECPQINLSNHSKAKKYLEKIGTVDDEYINLFNFFHNHKISCSIDIFLNIGDFVHIKQLYDQISEKNKDLLSSLKIKILIYSKENSFGHVALEKEEAIKYINKYFNYHYND